jgi:molybdopterin-guanine dinucleotide biosynthesis protein A
VNFSAVLLCGGESRRMGRDKATMQWNGKPLWQVQLEKLRALEPAAILLSARNDKAWRPPDVQLVEDPSPSRGPTTGIAAALRACSTSHLLVLAIDLPLMPAAYLKNIIAAASSGCGVVPRLGDRFEPVAAIYPRESADVFETGVSSLQVVVAELISRRHAEPLDVASSDYELFTNVNEPADLQRA